MNWLLYYFRATSFAERLRLGLAVIHGEQKEVESEVCDGRHSPPPSSADGRTFSFNVSAKGLDVPGQFCYLCTSMNANTLF